MKLVKTIPIKQPMKAGNIAIEFSLPAATSSLAGLVVGFGSVLLRSSGISEI